MNNLTWEYTILIFVAACGVLQLAAAHSGLQGLSFFKKPRLTIFFGFVAIIGAYVWFFATKNRNVLYPRLEGSQQFGNFVLGVFLAIVFTLIVSSLLRADMDPPQTEEIGEYGLNALRRMTYFEAMKRALLYLLRLLKLR